VRIDGSLLRGLATFRWLAWAWMATVLVLARRALVRPGVAVALVLGALLVTVGLTLLLRRDPRRLLTARAVGLELAVAVSLQVADGLVYAPGHVFSGAQPLGVAWPIAVALSAGVAFGPVVGVACGLVLGAGRAVSSVLAHLPDPAAAAWLGGLTAVQVLSLVTTSVMYALAGGVAGYGARSIRAAQQRLMIAERELAGIQAREEVARQLHDGVLQTLALVERRTGDRDLAQLAREQERELRAFLAGRSAPSGDDGGLGGRLRAAASRCERTYGASVAVLVPDDHPPLAAAQAEAVAGAVTEALTNACKHGQAARIVVYVEPLDDAVFVSVRDDGCGFDPTVTPEGMGLAASVRERIAQVDGEVSVTSAPGRGTEVTMRVPARSAGPAAAGR
jgi:signal transduction histidine kinase